VAKARLRLPQRDKEPISNAIGELANGGRLTQGAARFLSTQLAVSLRCADMDNDAFTRFFQEVVEQRIPARNRDRVQAYWRRFNTQPCLCLDDQRIAMMAQMAGKPIDAAAVSGIDCLNFFAFRMSLLNDAPEAVLRTLIQHELIHVDYRSEDTPEKHAEAQLRAIEASVLAPPKTLRSNPFDPSKIVQQMQARHFALLEEALVEQTNTLWGGNEPEARAWLWQKQQSIREAKAKQCSQSSKGSPTSA
jgi:hypothetical protein